MCFLFIPITNRFVPLQVKRSSKGWLVHMTIIRAAMGALENWTDRFSVKNLKTLNIQTRPHYRGNSMFPFATNQEQGREENVLFCGHKIFSLHFGDASFCIVFTFSRGSLFDRFEICAQVCHMERRLKQDSYYVTFKMRKLWSSAEIFPKIPLKIRNTSSFYKKVPFEQDTDTDHFLTFFFFSSFADPYMQSDLLYSFITKPIWSKLGINVLIRATISK